MIALRPTTLDNWISQQEPNEETATQYDNAKPMDTDKTLRIELSMNGMPIQYKAFLENWYIDGNGDLWMGFKLRRTGTLFKRRAEQVKFIGYEKERKVQNV